MKTYKKLLIAVMDTPSARHAGGQGLTLAASMGAEAVLVSVMPPYEGNMDRLYLRDMREHMEKPHRKVLDDLSAFADKVGASCRTMLVEGKPFESIVDAAEAEDADMIVLGGQSQSRLERSIMGETPARVIGYAHRDVLVVPEGAEVDFARILVATDGSRDSENASMRAVDLGRAYGGQVSAISVIDVPAEYNLWEKAMNDFTGRAKNSVNHVADLGRQEGIEVRTVIRQAEAAQGIVAEAEGWDATLIVLGTHGRTGLKRIMLGNVASGVLHHSVKPVLVAP